MSPTCEAYETLTEVMASEGFFLESLILYEDFDKSADSCWTLSSV